MEKFILFLPVTVGVVLVFAGIFVYLNRTKFGIHVTGKITDVLKSEARYSKVKVNTETPVVKYEVNGQTFTSASSKRYPEGVASFKRGKCIDIRVSRRNHRNFVPVENGGAAEKILISCGTFMIIAFCVMYFRYY